LARSLVQTLLDFTPCCRQCAQRFGITVSTNNILSFDGKLAFLLQVSRLELQGVGCKDGIRDLTCFVTH
jgi:hypothetical protein